MSVIGSKGITSQLTATGKKRRRVISNVIHTTLLGNKYMSFTIKLLILSVTLTLYSCATSNISKDYSFNSNSPKGLLVGTITWDGFYASYNIYIKNIKTNEVARIEAGGSMAPWNLFDSNGDLGHLGVKGDLFTLELEPGDYEAYTWKVIPGNNTPLYPLREYSIKLKINQGEALYFGSVNFKQTETYGSTISGVKTTYLNQYGRDVKEFRNRFKNVTLPEVQSPLNNGEQLALGEDVNPASEMLFNSISQSLSMPSTYK